MLRLGWSALLLFATLAGAGCAPTQWRFEGEVAQTQYGVVHVTSKDYRGLGYGAGYAYAKDNACILAEYIVAVRGEKSKYFGAAGANAANLQSDFFAKYYFDGAMLDAAYAGISEDVAAMITGYADGYNTYIANAAPEDYPEACRNAPWVKPITATDVYRMMEDTVTLMSAFRFQGAIVAAVPPGREEEASAKGIDTRVAAVSFDEASMTMGSNAWAFGGETTDNGGGLVVGNPHFPWDGVRRFYQIHLTIPGEYDVMGVSLPPTPYVSIGFNKDVAWSHTVSAGRRFTLFELALDADDPTVYLLDGEKRQMTQRTVEIEVLTEEGTIETRSHTFYETAHGSLLAIPAMGLTWTTEKAYAFGDGARLNTDFQLASLNIGKASSIAEIKAAIERDMGLTWVNTVAADRHGDAFYADISRYPNVTDGLLAACMPSAGAAEISSRTGMFILDGTDGACNWAGRERKAGAAYLPHAYTPSVTRPDYVANSNDSYWLVNDDYRFERKPAIVGEYEKPQNLRTRKELIELSEMTCGAGGAAQKVTHAKALDLLFANENHAAELFLDDILTICRQDKRLEASCTALAEWDRLENADSRGAVLFREFWRPFWSRQDLFLVPFDPEDPIHTPAHINTSDAAVREAIVESLFNAQELLLKFGFSPDVALGDVLTASGADGTRIPLHGGDGMAGVLNAMMTGPLSESGLRPVHGVSFIQIVGFDERGPVADGVLAYSQSVNPASPHYDDQTRLYSEKKLYRLPFHQSDILNDPYYRRIDLPVTPAQQGEPKHESQ